MKQTISDTDLTKLVKETNNNEALIELINRHSGIYIDMVKRFGFKSLSLSQVGDIIDEKDYNIYKAAIDYDENRAKFSTHLATKTKYICLTEKTKNKNKKPQVTYEEVDFFLESKDNSPEEYCMLSDYFSKVMNIILNKENEKTKNIFLQRYFGGSLNKLKPWSKVSKEVGLSSQGCINIHNRTIKKIQKKLENERIKL